MTNQKLYSLVRQAIDDYNMIQPHDKIAVGVSGGKDSIVLLYALAALRRIYHSSFELCAITVDLGLNQADFSAINVLCNSLNIEYFVVKTKIGEIVFDERKEQNPCSLCSKMRKGALHNKALELSCNKIAYAHHMDDATDTLLLSMLYEGRIKTFEPVTAFCKTPLTLIRPLIYVREAEIIGYINKYNINVIKSPCPVNGKTKRSQINQLLNQLNKDYPGIRAKIFHGMQKDLVYWMKEH